jgi:hypothetical protein
MPIAPAAVFKGKSQAGAASEAESFIVIGFRPELHPPSHLRKPAATFLSLRASASPR